VLPSLLAVHVLGINATNAAARVRTKKSICSLLEIPTMLSMADGKIKYPIAEAAKRKTTKVTIALLNCSFVMGRFDISFITPGFIDKDLHNHKDKQNENGRCAGRDNATLTEPA